MSWEYDLVYQQEILFYWFSGLGESTYNWKDSIQSFFLINEGADRGIISSHPQTKQDLTRKKSTGFSKFIFSWLAKTAQLNMVVSQHSWIWVVSKCKGRLILAGNNNIFSSSTMYQMNVHVVAKYVSFDHDVLGVCHSPNKDGPIPSPTETTATK